MFASSGHSAELADSRGIQTFDTPPERVIALSWSIAELLIKLDVDPVGITDMAGYRTWVVQPELPETAVEIGLRNEPNLERIAELDPDLIIISDEQDMLIPRLERIAPVAHFESFNAGQDNYAVSRDTYLRLGALWGKDDLAQERLDALDAQVKAAGERVAQHFADVPPPVAPIRLLTPTTARLHSTNSMAKAALDGMGLQHAAPGTSSDWGFRQLSVEDLAQFDAAIVLQIDPFAQPGDLFASPMWQFMPFVQAGHFAVSRPVWTFGSAFSVGYMADAFADALTTLDPKGP
ncbi:iron-siderophore ABC transporter substrate-binding protein [Tateyamaria sp. SN3-11]|uniref:iron-siderophore ABC transporter substrate-binding protein n=1 Tax=Tateyamaria sp. SN3-11 TaxID=3092147 RepID=UPI0039EB7648